METIDLENTIALRERALQAENDHNKLLADVLYALADSLDQIEALEDTETLEQWSNENGDAKAYKQFFEDCFEHLDGHYPCPSITNDYDCSVIFDAIERGEGATLWKL